MVNAVVQSCDNVCTQLYTMLKPLRGVYAHTYTRHMSYLYMVIRNGRAYIYKTNDISIYGDF